jgi:uncharacterized protein with PIN domain
MFVEKCGTTLFRGKPMMKFIVDAMLGKVALWLRLTGHDTIYSNELHDDELILIAAKEDRVLLTSDAKLNQRAVDNDVTSLLLRGTVDERIAEVFQCFNISLEIDPAKSRCSKCNGEPVELRGDDRERIKELVFDKTYNYYDVFWFCEDCQSVFFEGGHWKNMREYVVKIRSLVESRLSNSGHDI